MKISHQLHSILMSEVLIILQFLALDIQSISTGLNLQVNFSNNYFTIWTDLANSRIPGISYYVYYYLNAVQKFLTWICSDQVSGSVRPKNRCDTCRPLFPDNF